MHLKSIYHKDKEENLGAYFTASENEFSNYETAEEDGNNTDT